MLGHLAVGDIQELFQQSGRGLDMITCSPCRTPQHWSKVCGRLKLSAPVRRELSTPRLRVVDILKNSQPANGSKREDITVTGFIRSVRKQKRVGFAAIGDGSSIEALQTVLTPQQAEKYAQWGLQLSTPWTLTPIQIIKWYGCEGERSMEAITTWEETSK